MTLARHALSEAVKAKGLEIGFDLVAIGPADPPPHGSAFEQWLEAGYAGSMEYLERGREKRLNLQRILPGARSVIAVALNYYQGNPPEASSWCGVSRYAWGRDYHAVMEPKVETLLDFVRGAAGPETAGKVYVDTGPVLERDLAARAGLGWVGKNTMLIHPNLGSWFFLGLLLTTAELDHDAPMVDHCGSCTRCLDACPTEAFAAPYTLDARRCISYLTIELRGSIPDELRPAMGEWIFGCDICQAVCPWNRKAPVTAEIDFLPTGPLPGLTELLALDEAGFRTAFAGSPIRRAKLSGLRRSAAVALGNQKDPETVPALAQSLHDPDPLVRQHSAWALGQIRTRTARAVLGAALTDESASSVRAELESALGRDDHDDRAD